MSSAALCGVVVEFGVALECYHQGAHLVALGEHDFVELSCSSAASRR